MTQEALTQILEHGSPLLHAAALLASGVLCGWLTRLDARAWPLSRRVRIGLFVSVFVGGMAGCAIPAFFASDLIADLAFGQWRGPKTIMGGVLGAFFGAAIYKRLTGTAYDTSDAFARGTCVMMAVGRLGCIAQHCCFGIASPAWLGYDLGDGVTRFPVQIVEAVAVFGLFGIIEILHRRGAMKNRRLFVLFLSYGLIRFALEFLREQFAGIYLGLGFYQWLALAMAGIGAWQIRKRTPSVAARPIAATQATAS